MAEMQKQGGMPSENPNAIIPRRDVKPVADELQRIMEELGEGDMGPMGGAQGAPGEMPEGGAPMAGGNDEAMVVADMLDVSPDKAMQLLEAARAMPKLADMSAAEIGQMLASDMNLRMQVEKNIGASQDGMAREKMVKDQMGPKEPPVPMEPTPAGSMKK